MATLITEAVGAPLAIAPSLYGAPEFTNEIPFSRDLTQGWLETGTNIAVLDAVGLTGEPNTATTLTDDDGGLTELVQETIIVGANTDTYVVRAFYKKDTDTTRFPGLSLDLTTGGTRQRQDIQINTQTGALVSSFASGAGGTFESNQVGEWWEVLIEVTNSNNTAAVIKVTPAAGTVFGVESAAATGSIIVSNVELHL